VAFSSGSRTSPRWLERRAGGGKAPARELHAGASCLYEEDKGDLHKSPWSFGDFQ
jgi:hypothetical protein